MWGNIPVEMPGEATLHTRAKEETMSELRVFSYLPNSRIWKATIAARFVRDRGSAGAPPQELTSWLWDFDARPLSRAELAASSDIHVGKVGFSSTLRKTSAFCWRIPLGLCRPRSAQMARRASLNRTASCARLLRLGESAFPLYGRDAYEASRIDSFLDASLCSRARRRFTCWL